jgi:hypothetical protein
MTHTLRTYLDYFDKVSNVTLYFGEHKINIEFDKSGSYVLIKQFSNLKFEFVNLYKDTLTLKLI